MGCGLNIISIDFPPIFPTFSACFLYLFWYWGFGCWYLISRFCLNIHMQLCWVKIGHLHYGLTKNVQTILCILIHSKSHDFSKSPSVCWFRFEISQRFGRQKYIRSVSAPSSDFLAESLHHNEVTQYQCQTYSILQSNSNADNIIKNIDIGVLVNSKKYILDNCIIIM